MAETSVPVVSAAARANAAALARELAEGRDVLAARPTRLQIEVTNRCTLPCRSCAHRVWDRAANRPEDLPPATFARLAPLIETAEEVTFGGYGDPSLGPLLVPLVRAARGFGCRVIVTTGGAALTPDLIAGLASAGLDRVILSMDGARDETLRALRGVPLADFLGWMDALAAARGGGMRPELQLNFVAQADNVDELPELVDLAADRGAVGIHAFHIKVYDPRLAAQSLLARPEETRASFAEARARALRRGLFLRLPPLGPAEDSGCRQPIETLFVLHDGEVRACCASVFKNGRYGLVAGRLADAPDPAAPWNAPLPVAFRRARRTGDEESYPEPCRACPFRVTTPESHLRPLR